MPSTRPAPDPTARIRELHERGVGAMNAGRIGSGDRLLRAGLKHLGWPSGVVTGERAALTARILISLALVEIQLGRPDAGLGLLDEAARLVAPADRGLLLQQRGLMLVLIGRLADGLTAMDQAIPLLDPKSDVLARTLLNRAMLHQIAGRVRLALADLDRSEEIARTIPARGMDRLLAKVAHNRGYCALLAGDIPGALRALEVARAGFARHAEQLLPVVAVDRARVLLAAGLCTEAVTELDAAIVLFRGRRTQEYGEAELVRAQAALALGDPADARRWARRAEGRFHRRGNETWAAVARLTRLRAEFGTVSGRLAEQADQLAARLAELGLANDAEAATLLAARARVALGRPADAAETLAGRSGPRALLDTKLLRAVALAEFARATGARAQVFRQARAGLALLREHRGRFGSVDLAAGAGALGAELAAIGLAEALAHPVPARVFRWLELSRAQAFGLRPVNAPADPAIVDAVAELRQADRVVRDAELAGRPDPAARHRCAELARTVRAHGWQADGTGQRHAAEFADIAEALARRDTALASLLVHDGTLLAVVVAAGRATLHRLAVWSPVVEAVDRLHSDLDALCGRSLRPSLDAVVRSSAHRQLDWLASSLLGPIRQRVGDRDLVIVPTGALSGLPWGLLPDLRSRPVTVAPSATAWLHGQAVAPAGPAAGRPAASPAGSPAARLAGSPAGMVAGSPAGQPVGPAAGPLAASFAGLPVGSPAGLLAGSPTGPPTGSPALPSVGGPLLIAGPDLTHAGAEVAAIARLYPGGTVLTGSSATVATALPALAGCAVAHVAAHGHHEQENVLFSRLDLADGPLMAYDVQQLGAPPGHVVLSSCDVGRMVVRTGDEILGFTAALLYSGTRTVVSAVGRVPDDSVADVMYAYHRALASGAAPARALADCTGDGTLMPFVCFGAG